MNGADVNIINNARWLDQNVADSFRLGDKGGNTPLHIIVAKNNLKMLELCITQVEKNPHYQALKMEDLLSIMNNYHQTPLHVACGPNISMKIVYVLLQFSTKKSLSVTGNTKNTALHELMRILLRCNGWEVQLEMIFNKFFEIDPSQFQALNSESKTPLDLYRENLLGNLERSCIDLRKIIVDIKDNLKSERMTGLKDLYLTEVAIVYGRIQLFKKLSASQVFNKVYEKQLLEFKTLVDAKYADFNPLSEEFRLLRVEAENLNEELNKAKTKKWIESEERRLERANATLSSPVTAAARGVANAATAEALSSASVMSDDPYDLQNNIGNKLSLTRHSSIETVLDELYPLEDHPFDNSNFAGNASLDFTQDYCEDNTIDDLGMTDAGPILFSYTASQASSSSLASLAKAASFDPSSSSASSVSVSASAASATLASSASSSALFIPTTFHK